MLPQASMTARKLEIICKHQITNSLISPCLFSFIFLFSLHIFLLSNYICRHRQEFSIISPCLFFSDTFPNHRTMSEKNDNIYRIYNTYNNIFIVPISQLSIFRIFSFPSPVLSPRVFTHA